MRMTGTAVAIGACAMAGVAGVFAVSDATERADAQVRVTASQLTINQRISQAAVRRGNEALQQIATLRQQIATLTGGVPIPVILRGASSGTAGESLLANRGAVGVTAISSQANGRYTVSFDRNIASCFYQATIVAESEAQLTGGRSIRVALDIADGARTRLTVLVSRADGRAARAPFHIEATC